MSRTGLSRREVIALFSASLPCLLTRSDADSNSLVPLTERDVWIGAYAPPAPWLSMTPVTKLENSIGRRLDIVHIYTAWGEEWGAYSSEIVRQLSSAVSDGRRALITWEPWTLGQGVNQDEFSLRRIARGSFDSYIRTWAKGLGGFPGTVYLRPMHEMNGDWYPWCVGVNGNRPQDYTRAWRRMWSIFQQEHVTNVRWIWCPYAVDDASKVLEQTYPGDRYVNLLGLDVYNWGTSVHYSQDASGSNRWRPVEECLEAAYRRISGFAPQPVWLPEVGCAEDGGDKAQWLKDLLGSPGYDRISAVVFFDVDKERDWRVDSSLASVNAVAASLAGTRPANESEISPPTPFGVRAERWLKAIKVSWSVTGNVSTLIYAITIFADGEALKTLNIGSSGRYTFRRPIKYRSYSFAAQSISQFGASAMSEQSAPISFN
jgi:beta-mannanase